jgi:pilus assembly protein CpaE
MNTTTQISVQVPDPALRREVEALSRELPGLALAQDAGPAGVAFLAVEGDGRAALAESARLTASGQVREVFLAGAVPSPEFLLAAMRQSVQEYLVRPLGRDELAAALRRFQARWPRLAAPAPAAAPHPAFSQAGPAPAPTPFQRSRGGRILAVVAARSGAGATTLAVNLALAAQAGGQANGQNGGQNGSQTRPGRAVLVDLRRGLGESPLFLDLECAYTWAEAAENIHRLDDTFLDSVLTRHASGLAVLPAPGPHAPDQAAPGRMSPAAEAEALGRVIGELSRRFPLVVVDAGAGVDRTLLAALAQAHPAGARAGADCGSASGAGLDLVLVLPLSLPGLVSGRRALEALDRAVPELGATVRLALNRQVEGSDLEPEEAGEALGRPVSWVLPEDSRAALAALNQGQPLSQAAPKSALAKAVARMARDLNLCAPDAAGTGRFSLAGLFRSRRAAAISAAGTGAGTGAGADAPLGV